MDANGTWHVIFARKPRLWKFVSEKKTGSNFASGLPRTKTNRSLGTTTEGSSSKIWYTWSWTHWSYEQLSMWVCGTGDTHFRLPSLTPGLPTWTCVLLPWYPPFPHPYYPLWERPKHAAKVKHTLSLFCPCQPLFGNAGLSGIQVVKPVPCQMVACRLCVFC